MQSKLGWVEFNDGARKVSERIRHCSARINEVEPILSLFQSDWMIKCNSSLVYLLILNLLFYHLPFYPYGLIKPPSFDVPFVLKHQLKWSFILFFIFTPSYDSLMNNWLSIIILNYSYITYIIFQAKFKSNFFSFIMHLSWFMDIYKKVSIFTVISK
jgi:hypothetical protein